MPIGPDLQPWIHRGLCLCFSVCFFGGDRRCLGGVSQVAWILTSWKAWGKAFSNAGRVLTHDWLQRQLWGGRHVGDVELLRTFVKWLRRKLGDDARKPAYIFTERGVGYRMARPGEP